jgi:hypothetical protein
LTAARSPDGFAASERGQVNLALANGSETGKWSASGMVALVGLPGLNRFVYATIYPAPVHQRLANEVRARRPRLNEEMVRALTTCPATGRGACHLRIPPGTTRLRHRIALGTVPHPVSILGLIASGFARGGEEISPSWRARIIPIGMRILAALKRRRR